MGKSKADKRVNRIVKEINKTLQKDLFKDRFWIKQVKKAKTQDTGAHYYLYEMKDRLEPNRDSLVSCGWIGEYNLFIESELYEQINDFIVRSSFWSIYYDDPSRYSYDLDFYAHPFYHYHTKEIDK